MIRNTRPNHAATLSFVHDLAMTAIAFVLALYLRVGNEAFGEFWPALTTGLPITLAIAAITYQVFGLYRSMWRYVSLSDLVQIIKAITVVVLAFVLVLFLLTRLIDLPRSHPPIMWFVLTVLIGAPRFAFRIMNDGGLDLAGRESAEDAVPALLIGAGNGTDSFLRWLAREKPAPYHVIGIVAEEKDRVGLSLHNVPIVGTIEDLSAVGDWLRGRNLFPQRAIMTESTSALDGSDMREIFSWADDLGMSLSRLPRPVEFKKANPDQRIEIHPVDVADLLHRPQTKLDEGALGNLILGRIVVITGAGGTIGSELARQVASYGPANLILIDNSEFNLYRIDVDLARDYPSVSRQPILCDIRASKRLADIFHMAKPHLVFHAAALKHVPLVEVNPAEAILTNCVGSRNVADAAISCGAQAMVVISTDKAVGPTSVMGATKRITERYCQSLDWASRHDTSNGQASTQFVTVRFGNVLGSSGSVVPLFQEQLAAGGPITVTDPKATRYFMTAREAVQLVLQASAHATTNRDERGRILVLEMGDPVNIVDLARQMIRLQGLRPGKDIAISFTGLRAGEKMHENLVDDDEEPVPTACAGVMAISPAIADISVMRQRLGDLENAAMARNARDMQNIIQALVPNFTGRVDEPSFVPESAGVDANAHPGGNAPKTVRLVGRH